MIEPFTLGDFVRVKQAWRPIYCEDLGRRVRDETVYGITVPNGYDSVTEWYYALNNAVARLKQERRGSRRFNLWHAWYEREYRGTPEPDVRAEAVARIIREQLRVDVEVFGGGSSWSGAGSNVDEVARAIVRALDR